MFVNPNEIVRKFKLKSYDPNLVDISQNIFEANTPHEAAILINDKLRQTLYESGYDDNTENTIITLKELTKGIYDKNWKPFYGRVYKYRIEYHVYDDPLYEESMTGNYYDVVDAEYVPVLIK